jgi:hypothetical protein
MKIRGGVMVNVCGDPGCCTEMRWTPYMELTPEEAESLDEHFRELGYTYYVADVPEEIRDRLEVLSDEMNLLEQFEVEED